MSNILIAQIGRGNYQATSYLNGELMKSCTGDNMTDTPAGGQSTSQPDSQTASYTTGYTFEAIIHEIGISMKKQIDHVVLIGTATSYFGTLLHYYYRKSMRADVAVGPEGYKNFVSLPEMNTLCGDMELESFTPKGGNTIFNIKIKNIHNHLPQIEMLLTRYISTVTGNENLKIKIVIIRHGTNSDELEENFNLLQKSVEHIMDEENTSSTNHSYNIFFDISNGFRSLPMYIYTFVNYLLRIRDEQFKLHMFYGMADGKQNGIAPIVNLENINGMMDWINAANEFHNYGSVRQLDRLLENNADLHRLFQQFDYASNANNLGVLKTTTEHIIELKDIEYFTGLPYYAKTLLCKIGDEFHREFGQESCNPGLKKRGYSYAYLTIHLAHWYMEQGRTGNAAIALQEGITTFMMERWPNEADHLIAAEYETPHGRYFEEDFTRWLFDFKNRFVISGLLKEKTYHLAEKIKSGAELSLTEEMAAIREYIRNPEAHILINQISDGLIEKSQQILNEMITWMLHLTSNQVQEADEKHLFCRIPGTQPVLETVKAYFMEINNLDHTAHTVTIDDPEIREAARELEKDLQFLKTCQITSISSENAMIQKCQNKIHTRKHLKKFLEKWLEYDSEDHDKNPAYSYDACKKLLQKNRKNRTTEQRIIGWISTHSKDIAEIVMNKSC